MRLRLLAVCATALVPLALASSSGSAATSSPVHSAAWCGGSISVQSARREVGERVRVKARVVRSFYARSSRGRPTFINLGYDYPDRRRLTLVVWGRDRVNFPRAPERMFIRGVLVCAQGVVSTYGNAAEIEVGVWNARARMLSF